MRDSEELQDKEWSWVAHTYRATPKSTLDTDAFVDRLMREVDVAAVSATIATTADIPTDTTVTAARLSERTMSPDERRERTLPLPYRRTIPLPMWGGFAAALIMVFAGGLWLGRTSMRNNLRADPESLLPETTLARGTTSASPVASTAHPTAASRTIQFVLSSPRASRVTLVGDFNGWDVEATPMASRPGSGLWTVSVPLPAGRHVYAFVVDGDEWVADPAAPQVAVNAFGSQNSVVIVGGSI